VRSVQLPPLVKISLEAADLLDPTAMSEADQDDFIGAVGFGTLALFLLPVFEIGAVGDLAFSAIIGGGLSAYLALRKDSVGLLARSVAGRQANRAAIVVAETADYVEETYQVSDKVKKSALAAGEAVKQKASTVLSDVTKN